MKRALIIGVAGQDGYYLTQLLVKKGYAVYGTYRSIMGISPDLLEALSGTAENELSQPGRLAEYVSKIRPDEIYYLAAHHFSSAGDENRAGRMSPFLFVNLIAPNEVLEVLQTENPEGKFFYAASAQIFGAAAESPQSEETPYRPATPYAISKATGVLICKYYRETHGIFTVAGILYNHESPRRASTFVTTQIARAAALAANGRGKKLVLKDLNAVVDWGAAEDYVEAMWYTLQQPVGGEYIISTGVPRTVKDFAKEAFKVVGLRAEDYVMQESEIAGSKAKPYIGNNSKIKRVCGWQPLRRFESLVREMVEAQLALHD